MRFGQRRPFASQIIELDIGVGRAAGDIQTVFIKFEGSDVVPDV